jgi:hypothetical protein
MPNLGSGYTIGQLSQSLSMWPVERFKPRLAFGESV